MNDERRRQPRVSINAPATISVAEHKLAATAKNLSERGLFCITDAGLDVGSEIDIVLAVPEDAGLPVSGILCCRGRIARVERGEGNFGIGVEFDGLQAASLS